ncbi:MAG: T9SS type A sorting domain-containing protein [Firmicutes bacterium]|nr:T9SS type A sorting domain-containing protein [Bacillota bacterium]MCM1400473.1 T9SS type A sorting domain-containing protein [Bacteroides sp.]MCM1477444.1 T9SS type A sorting domain-containing protein [Bacteroides sp.]
MNKIFSLRTLALGLGLTAASASMAVAPQIPDVESYINYTGTSFDAYWGPVSGAKNYVLNVFNKVGDPIETSVDFSNPTPAEYWTYTSSGTHKAPDNKDYILLKEDGDGVLLQLPDGTIDDFVISGLSIGFNGDNITDANSINLCISLYDNTGRAWRTVTTSGWAFAMQSSIPLREAFSSWPEDVVAIRIFIKKSAAQVNGEIALTGASYTTRERNYIVKDFETPEFIITVNGLDPEEIYYFFVQSQNAAGEKSNRSELVKVDGFLAPASTSHSNVTETSYTAEWAPSAKAEVYYINHYRLDKAAEGDNVQWTMTETFSKATQGTIDNPVTVEDPDEIADNLGWRVYGGIAAKGMLGCGEGSRSSSFMYTPAFDATSDDGKFYTYIHAFGTPGRKINIIRQDKYGPNYTAIMKTVTFGEDGWIDETLEWEDGATNTKFTLEEYSGVDKDYSQKNFFLDEYKVGITRKEGAMDKRFLYRRYTEGRNNTSYTFTDLQPGCSYGFEVEAGKLDTEGEEMLSAKSEFHTVTLLGEAAIDLIDRDGSIEWNNGKLVTNLTEAAAVEVFDLNGRKVAGFTAPAGASEVDLNLPGGTYVVVVGNSAHKYIVK